MKTLTDYTQQKTTDLFNRLGAFFAFTNEQFEKGKKDNTVYTSIFGGLLVPSDNAKELLEELETIGSDGRAQDLAENGKNGVIRRELFNHECFYTYEIDDCALSLTGYGITKEEIRAVFDHIRKTEDIDG